MPGRPLGIIGPLEVVRGLDLSDFPIEEGPCRASRTHFKSLRTGRSFCSTFRPN